MVEIEEVARDIFRIPVPLPNNPLRELNAYLIRGSDRSMLIDTGFRLPECRQALEEGLTRAGADRARLDVLLTHIHTDHTGLCADVVGSGRSIYIGAGDFPMTRGSYMRAFWADMDRLFIRAGFPLEEAQRSTTSNPARTLGPPPDLAVCRPLQDGETLPVGEYMPQVVAVPGHTPGQICLWLAEQEILFTADHVLFDITPNITAWTNLDNALGQYLDSLRKIRAYPVRLALPAHRQRGQLVPRIDRLLEHHQNRLAEVLTAIRASPGCTAYEIAAAISWDIRAKDWASFPLNQKWFAVGETLAHLDFLLDQKQIFRSTRPDGMDIYDVQH